jgi:hydrogenase maturation protein HypF
MTTSITVLGIVQGVGYRPFVARLAQELGIAGVVMNNGGIVEIVADGEKEAMDNFVHRLELHQLRGAKVTQIRVKHMPEQHFEGFLIIPSAKKADEIPLLPPDLPLCETCKRELYDPDNRRFRYPFISCVGCGPRYSIMDTLPYDRETTSMDSFAMCPACEREYTEDRNRRRHAQTISCHDCGPQLILQISDTVSYADNALEKGIELLRQGKVLAIKGIGGYQFACLPTDAHAVEQLRLLKQRDKKPFAVMFPNLQMIQSHCHVDAEEERLLTSSACPIVLLSKKTDVFCSGVSGESRYMGAFLPYTPLHQLLTDACGALVMTSGNRSAEPIIVRDEDMLQWNSPYLAGVLYNTRRIVTPLDDSVTRVVCGKEQVVRRSRGYVPLPISLQQSTRQAVLAMGGDLKSCFCLYQQDRAYLSQYFGDMESYSVSQAYQENLTRMEDLFGISPTIIACDLHPQYLTVRLAEKQARSSERKQISIQHHHAHAASVMAEHALTSCIGVVFDGTGYGTDGAVWGGEFLLCNDTAYERRAHLEYVTLSGGDAAAKKATLTAYGYLHAAGETVDNREFLTVQAAIENRINTQKSSSMGRLFDAVSAVLAIKKTNSYEGECAIALENVAAAYQESGGEPYPLHAEITRDGLLTLVDQMNLLKEIYFAFQSGADKGALALGFHNAIAEMVFAVCTQIRKNSGENTVALSGGVFANRLLTQDCVEHLEQAGFQVFLNSAVPTNDGGISLGQAWLCRNL